jgi:hypothetical protein
MIGALTAKVKELTALVEQLRQEERSQRQAVAADQGVI